MLAGSIPFTLDTTNPHTPKLVPQGGVNIYDPTQYVVSSYTIPHYASTQLNFEGATSYARRYSTHEHYGSFEMGLKVRNGHKRQSENDFIYDNQPGAVTLAQVLGTFTNPTYYDKAYQFGPMSDYQKIIQLVGGNLSQLGYDQSASISSSIPAVFDANERVYAGYLMNTIGFGRLSVQGGVRFEATDATYRSGALDISGNPTSVTGTSNESPSNNPISVPPATAKIATVGVRLTA